jgi:UDP-N-acetylmuramoylalanine--D-glutamate ligase
MNLPQGKPVLIIGAARQGQALARFLSKQGVKVILNDQHPSSEMQEALKAMESVPVEWVLGEHPLELLDEVDVVCVSGGVPLTLPILQEAARRGKTITNDSQLFMQAVRAQVIGITGSSGKTTTTTLVGRIAEAGLQPPRNVWVGGNIGLPLIEYLDEIEPNDIVVLELSSFQLEQMTLSPHIAAVLNITPNHLDRHGSMQAYTAAKARILDFQHSKDVAVLNRDDAGSWGLLSHVKGSLVTFGMSAPAPEIDGTFLENGMIKFQKNNRVTELLPLESIALRGEHNLYNVLAACAISLAAGMDRLAANRGIAGFAGVSHRLELVRELNGVSWYNDSIATTPERTLAAVNSFDEPIVLLLGGRDKHLPWDELSAAVHQKVDHVVLFGEAADLISHALGTPQPGDRLLSIEHATTLQDALERTRQIARPGDVVLLSPGGTSFDEFKDFEARGEFFENWVNQL